MLEPATTLRFATAAKAIATECHSLGLVVPGFRCPPRVPGVDRTLRRRGGGVVIAVRVHGRPWAAVVADMVDGVVATVALDEPLAKAEADRLRRRLWAAVTGQAEAPAPAAPATVRPAARVA